jgi:tetratricopeptide (TPR) repeat protein
MATLLASALAKARRFKDALNVIDTALNGFDDSPLFCDAELPRWRGQLLLMQEKNVEQAEECFREALGIAVRQNAKSLELRAALGLSQVLDEKGRRTEAQQVLAPLYSWFSEGLETSDLRNANNVLNSLP